MTDHSRLLTRRDMLAAMPLMAAASRIPASFAQVRKPRVAVVTTAYFANSHADWICQKFMRGYFHEGSHLDSRVDIASMHILQFPENDLGRRVCAANNIALVDSVAEAVTLGGKEPAVDGVLVIGEHGGFHTTIYGQTLYPRWSLYNQVMQVFRRSGKVVPVFCDKHLSWDWDEAKWMYDQSRELGFPFMAGSSLPSCHRKPEIELDPDAPLRHGVAASYGGKDAYGFHALETLQCFAERRAGGETGVASVQCIEGPEVWNWTDRTPWAGSLLETAMNTFTLDDGTKTDDDRRMNGNVRDNARDPILFIVKYRDGFQGAAYILNGHLRNGWAFAGDVRGKAEPFAVLAWHCFAQGQYIGANMFVHHMQDLVITGKEPNPVERTLLTTGMLASLCRSNWENGAYSEVGNVMETPYLDITYRAPDGVQYDTGPRPPGTVIDRGF